MKEQIFALALVLISASLARCANELPPPQIVTADLGYGTDQTPIADQFVPADLTPDTDGPAADGPAADGPAADATLDLLWDTGPVADLDAEVVATDSVPPADLPPLAEYTLTPSAAGKAVGEVGGPFNKTTFDYILANLGATAFEFGVEVDQTWLTVSPATGNVNAAQAAQIVVTLAPSANALPSGNHDAVLTLTIGKAQTKRLIGLTVVNPGTTAFVKVTNNPLLSKGPSGTWNELGSLAPSVIHTGTEYVMLYFGLDAQGKASIGQASSSDGLSWTPYAGNPIIAPGDPDGWNAVVRGPGSLILDASGVWHAWYTTVDKQGASHIGHASAATGAGSWTVTPDSVFEQGAVGTWDSSRIDVGAVVLDNSTYKMWYLGQSPVSKPNETALGYATSTDGLVWNRFAGNPIHVATSEGWDSFAILKDNSVFRMWRVLKAPTTDETIGVFYGDSTNGVNWKFELSSLLAPDPGKWDSHSLVGISVLRYSEQYLDLWYSGCSGLRTDCAIGYASNP